MGETLEITMLHIMIMRAFNPSDEEYKEYNRVTLC